MIENIKQAKEKLADYPLPVEYVQVDGDPAEEILVLAETKHCDGIIIGSRLEYMNGNF